MYPPWPDMFDDAAMAKLARHLPLGDKVEAARSDFQAVGERIRAIIDATPSSFDHGPMTSRFPNGRDGCNRMC